MSAPLRRVLVRQPARSGDFLAAGWRQPDPGRLVAQHAEFVDLLTRLDCEVEVAPAIDNLVDACYIRDPGILTPRGAIIFAMAKPVRRAEPAALREALSRISVPVVGELGGEAHADGGDLVWLDEATLLVGRSYRTNAAAVEQFRAILAPDGITVMSVDLPHDRGPGHVLHLMSFLSPVADDLAVVFPPLAPVALMQLLADRGVTIVDVDVDEYESMGCNVLAVRPRQVVMVAGNPRTRAALEKQGCEVFEYHGDDISVAGDGGPTCLTQPLWRK